MGITVHQAVFIERYDDNKIRGDGDQDVFVDVSTPTTDERDAYRWLCDKILEQDEFEFDNQAEFETFCRDKSIPENLLCLDKYNRLTLKNNADRWKLDTVRCLYRLFGKGEHVPRKWDYEIYDFDIDININF